MAGLESHDWADLPDHILLNVFSYLNLHDRYSASLTCFSWLNIFRNPYLWQKFSFWFYLPEHSKYLKCAKTYGQYLKYVNIGLNQALKENRQNACTVLELLSNTNRRRLKSIAIEFSGENPLFYAGQEFIDGLKILFSPCGNGVQPPINQICHVDLSGLSAAYDDDLFDLLSENNPDLEFLNVQNKILVCKLTPTCVLRLVKRCTKLKDLRVFHCSMSDDVLHELSQGERSRLEHLSIMCRREEKYGKDLSSDAWQEFADNNLAAKVTLGFDHTCPLNLVSVIMKPEIPVHVLRLETYTRIFDEVNLAVTYYKSTLETVALQTRNSNELGEALINLARSCSYLRCLLVYCVLKKDVVDQILDLRPALRESKNYILKWQMESEPWVVGQEEGD